MKYVRLQWDRVGAWIAVALGALAVFLGWLGVSRTEYVAEQIPYVVSGGLLGLVLVSVGVMLWLSADLRDEWRKLDTIEEVLRSVEGFAEPATQEEAAAIHPSSSVGRRRQPLKAAPE